MPAQDLVIVLRVDDKGTRVIKQFATSGTASFNKLGAETKKTAGKFKNFTAQAKSSFRTFATGLLPVMGMMGAINLLRRSVMDMIRTGMEFETAMANVGTLTRQSQEEVERMRDAVLDLSPTLGKAADMAQGLYQTISAGIPIGKNGAVAIGFLAVAAKTAKAGLSDMDSTVRLLASTLNAYNMQMGTSEQAIKSVSIVSDILFGTVKYGITTMKELVASIPRVTATASALNIPLTEVGAALAALTARGLTTRIAVLSLNRMLMTFVKTTPKSASAAKALGLEWDAAGVIVGGIPHIIEQISKATVKVTPEIRRFAFESNNNAEIQRRVAEAMGMNVTKLAQLFPNVSSLRAALMLTADQGERFREILKGMEEGVKGLGGGFSWTEEAMKRHMATASFWITTMGNIFDKFKIQFFLGITESFREGVKSSEDFQSKVDEWTRVSGKKVKEFAIKMGDVIKKGGELVKTISKIAKELITLMIIAKGMKLAAPFLGASTGAIGFVKNIVLAQKGVGALRLSGIGLGGVLGKLGLIGVTAFAAWKIGRVIGEVTGLDEKIQGVTTSVITFWQKVWGLNKEIEEGVGHQQAMEVQTEALAKATKLAGEEVTSMNDARKLLYIEWKKTGDLGNETLNNWIKKMVDLDVIDEKNLKTSIERREEQEKLKTDLDKLFTSMEDMNTATEKQAKEWEEWSKKATDAIKGVWDFVRDMKVSMGKWEMEFSVKVADDFGERAKEGFDALFEIEQELYEKTVVAKMSEVGQKLYENKKYFDGLRTQIAEEKRLDAELYKSKTEELEKYYQEQRDSLNKRIDDARREIGLYEEIQRAKMAIQSATSEWEIQEAKVTAESRLNSLRQSGLQEIAESEAKAKEKLEGEKRKLDERTQAYDTALGRITVIEKESKDKIIKGDWDIASNWKEMNKEIEADTIRSITNILKTGGNLWEGIKGIFDSIVNYWIDKVVNEIVKGGGDIWGSLKKGFSGLAGSISGVFSNVGGAVKGLGGLIGGAAKGAGGFVGDLIGKFGAMAGPIGAAISIGSKLPIIGDVIKGITGKVTGLLSKIPLIGGLFKKSETEAEKAAREMKELVDGLITTVSKWGDITESTAEAIAQDIKDGMEGAAAVSKHYVEVLEDVGITQESINDQWQGATKILATYEGGILDAADASKSAGESFEKLLESAKKFGTEGSKAMIDFIREVRASGLEVQEVTDYINDQLGVVKSGSMSAAQGLEAMAGAVGTNTEALGILEAQTFAVYNAMIANGATYSEAMASLGGVLDSILEKHTEMGTEASAGIQELLKIRQVTEANKELFAAMEGNLAVLNALGNTGSLTQETFNNAAVSATSYYNQMMDAGMTSNQALSQMAPTLERLRYLAREQGMEIDATTQAMIKQAEEQGILGEEQLSLQDTLMAGFGAIIQAIGGDVPDAFKKAMGKMDEFATSSDTAFERVKTGVGGIQDSLSGLHAPDLTIDIVGDFGKLDKQMKNYSIPIEPIEETHAQVGYHGIVTEPVQRFVAHRGEEVDIWRKGEERNKENEGGNLTVTIEPVVLSKDNEYIINFITKKIERAGIRIPIRAVRGE